MLACVRYIADARQRGARIIRVVGERPPGLVRSGNVDLLRDDYRSTASGVGCRGCPVAGVSRRVAYAAILPYISAAGAAPPRSPVLAPGLYYPLLRTLLPLTPDVAGVPRGG